MGEEKQYRIGEYAHYMGVTPDFLKHYEQFRLVSSNVRKNGYRYYDFDESFRILECMRLRNYGIPLRDIDAMVNDDDIKTLKEKLDRHKEVLEGQIRFKQAILKEQEFLYRWLDNMADKKEDWQVTEVEEMYFLPRSNGHDFLEDERIYSILKEWVAWAPVVKSCMEIRYSEEKWKNGEGFGADYSWGLTIPRRFAEEYGLAINEVVKRVSGRKWFLYSFMGLSNNSQQEIYTDPHHPALRKLREMQLKPTGDFYKLVLMYYRINSSREQCGVIMIPVE